MAEHFHFGGCDTVALAREFGTPLYVVSEDDMLARMREVKAAFDDKYERAKTHYASKAFLTKDMIRLAASEDLGLDVVSGGELHGAMALGFPPERIVFHGNGKTPEEIATGLDYGVGRFVCDSVGEIELLNRLAGERGATAKILIRVTPGVDSHTHAYISTGQADSKFGVPLSVLLDALDVCGRMERVDLMGFHFHIGSQLLENSSHLLAVGILLSVIDGARATCGFVTRELNLGGGFGVHYTSNDKAPPIGHFIDPMVEKIESYCAERGLNRPDLSIEPGRWIVAEAGVTLYSVVSVKEIPGVRSYASVDGGLPDNPRPALYQAEYDAVVANKYDRKATETMTIAGRCCETGDILIRDLRVPPIKPGDVLAVKSTGAYCHSMASNYNKLPFPAVVALRGGVPRVSVRRQTYDELYERDA